MGFLSGVPEGRLRIAQPFRAGTQRPPQELLESRGTVEASAGPRDSGKIFALDVPRDLSLGYSQSSLVYLGTRLSWQ